MKEELISVVLTSYNHREYLDTAISHILDQTYENIELIIIDDCSTDGSQEVIKKYLDDPRVKVFLLEENLGSYVKSTNLGASYALGKYINFAQCDDFSDRKQLEKLYLAMKQHSHCGVVYSGSYMIDEQDAIIGNDFECRTKEFRSQCAIDTTISGSKMRTYLYQSCVIPNLSAVLLKSELFKKINGLSDEFLVLADWDMWLRLSYITDFYYCHEKLNYFRQHSTTIRSKISLRKQLNELFLMHLRNKQNVNPAVGENFSIYYNVATVWLSYANHNWKNWMKAFPGIFKKSLKLSIWISIFLPFGAINICYRKLCS